MATFVKLLDGRTRVLVRKAGLPVRSRIFPTKWEAQQRATAIEGRIAASSGGYIAPLAQTTVQKLINAYKDEIPNIGRSKLAYLLFKDSGYACSSFMG